jgi:hypothetical protein
MCFNAPNVSTEDVGPAAAKRLAAPARERRDRSRIEDGLPSEDLAEPQAA